MKGGKPYVMFGDGRLAACKPISESDLAAFIADCVQGEDRVNQVMPIGGGSSIDCELHTRNANVEEVPISRVACNMNTHRQDRSLSALRRVCSALVTGIGPRLCQPSFESRRRMQTQHSKQCNLRAVSLPQI